MAPLDIQESLALQVGLEFLVTQVSQGLLDLVATLVLVVSPVGLGFLPSAATVVSQDGLEQADFPVTQA